MEGIKKEVLFLVCVCVFERYSNRQRHIVEVEELYNTWKKLLASLWQLLYIITLHLLHSFFPTMTLHLVYALGIC